MKHRLKGLLALVLSLTMVFALATNAWAAPAPSATSVKIGHSVTSVTLNSTNPYWKNDGTPASANDYNAYFDAANGILTLYDANISVTNYAYGIRANGNLTINLIGGNEVMSAGESGGAYGVRCDGTLTIKGSGSLTAVGANPDYPTGYGIYANSIVITEGTVIAQGKVRAVDVNTTPSFGNTHNATASENFDGSNPVSAYNATNIDSYKYLKIQPIICTVTFDLNGRGTMTTATQTDIPKGDKVTEPAPAPTEAGWTFGGWYEDAACTNAYDFTSAVHSSFTLYAKWTKNTYTVTFDDNGHGTAPATQTDIPAGGKVDKPADPTEAGWTFGGWYTDDGAWTDEWKFDVDTVTSDITLYAKWTENSLPAQYTVSFMNGDTEWESTTVDPGDTLAIAGMPVPPAPVGYKFAGWYTEDGIHVAHGMTVNSDLVAYATWSKLGGGGIPTPESEKTTSPKTFDSGVALHIGMTILAASGSAWLAKKKD